MTYDDSRPPSPQSRGPLLVAIALLLLPTLYLGSYFSLVSPGNTLTFEPNGPGPPLLVSINYRTAPKACSKIFWPLEQLDRQLRPTTWSRSYPFNPWTDQ